MFEVGKKVVCIKDFSDPASGNFAKIGDEFVVLGIKKAQCKCHSLDLDVGFKLNPVLFQCCEFCKGPYPKDYVQWIASLYFSPIDQEISDFSIESLMENIEKEPIEKF